MVPSLIVHFLRCVLLTDKGKLEMSRNKFLDCGEMLILGGQARSSLEDNHPCARMVPLVVLDEETDLPEMKGPNTYRCPTGRLIKKETVYKMCSPRVQHPSWRA